LSGYRWLLHICADALGTRFESLVPLLGQIDAQRILNDWKLNNALKLVRFFEVGERVERVGIE
jgi:hypothetical protein